MSNKTNNPPAFPQPEWVEYGRNEEDAGMTLRDYFAGQIIAAIIAQRGPCFTGPAILSDAEFAYQYADAMLAERAK